MALNSAVTADGGEIGRCQAVQPMACGLEPVADMMNPVLHNPSREVGAPGIMQGRAREPMKQGSTLGIFTTVHRGCT